MTLPVERLLSPPVPVELVSVPIPTPFGEFVTRAFECPTGFVYLALTKGDLSGDEPVLTRLHSECLTGDALGSLRCDCGVQLRLALRAIAAEGRGALIYVTGHEGRGIGLVNKLRAYVEQDGGVDTLDANLRLGLAVDSREYLEAASVLRAIGVGSVRLLTNNPDKVRGLRQGGIQVDVIEPIATASHARNRDYLTTKQLRLGHLRPLGLELEAEAVSAAPDVSTLLGPVRRHADRPHVVLKYAQTLDGRIATSAGDSKWISGEEERALSHALRAACDAVLVGVGTVLQDDPRLTVRMVPGASPTRVVLDSTLRTPGGANVVLPDAATVILTTDRADPGRVNALRATGVAVKVVASGPAGVDLAAGLSVLADLGVRSVLVEGGGQVITSMLAAGFVDRLVVALAPRIIGSGTDAVGPLGAVRVTDGLALENRSVHLVGDDVVLAWDVAAAPEP